MSQTEQVPVHSLDIVAGMVSEWLDQLLKSLERCGMAAKCWDLKAAYKQLPLSDEAFARDSFFVIFNHETQCPEVYRQRVLPFGSKASVTGFIRAAFGLWRIGLVCLGVIWSFDFDDFLNICRSTEKRHLDIVLNVFFRLLGWKVSHDKLVPYDTCCKVLASYLDLGQALKGYVLLKNTDRRRHELVFELERVLQANSLTKADAERLRGRLQFASGRLCGRLARQALHAFSSSRPRGPGLGDKLTWAIKHLLALLKEGHPREVSRRLANMRLVFVDASFEPGGYCGIGGLVYSDTGCLLHWFGCKVPDSLVTLLCQCFGRERETVIYELEALAVVLALDLLKDELKHSNAVVFTDNSGVHGSFVKCWSDNPVGNALAYFAALREFELHAFFYYDRVPSASNPADEPSRGECALPVHKRINVDARCITGLLESVLSRSEQLS